MAYFANATEGSTFDSQCANCKIGTELPADIKQLLYKYTQMEFGK